MTVGVIFTAYNMADTLSKSLASWIYAHESYLDGHHFRICAVSVPFVYYNEPRTDDTLSILQRAREAGLIDNIILSESPLTEVEARGLALNDLIDNKCDIIIQVDADEFYTSFDISRILSFVSAREYIMAFTVALKNYVFDNKTYLVKPFCPMRIHRTRMGNLKAHCFYADNSILYRDVNGFTFKDIELTVLNIPKSVAWIPHMSWPNNERSKKKVEYQMARWGDACSFRWDDKAGLCWAPNAPIPEIMSE